MKRIACVVVGLAVAASSTGCCCLGALFGHGYGGGYGGQCAPCAQPAGGCYSGQCGYGPGVAPYQMGPTGYVAPLGTTAAVPYTNSPVFAMNAVPAL